MNSLRSLARAVEYEAARQIEVLEAGDAVVQETRHWDENEGRTHSMRSKEEAFDYRYFPEPDLVPVEPGEEWLAEVAGSLPLLPAARRFRVAEAVGVDAAAAALVVEKGFDELVLAAVGAGADGRVALTHAEQNLTAPVDPTSFARLVALQVEGSLTPTQAKQVLAEMQETGASPDDIAKAHGFEAMTDDALAAIVEETLAAHPDAWSKFVAGDQKVAGFFIGEVMKATRGKANGKVVTSHLRKRAGMG
jgi:aspartyl-tRNA(Asn)/glutamyl-tRNA(Gln) amidotransferase subunit B